MLRSLRSAVFGKSKSNSGSLGGSDCGQISGGSPAGGGGVGAQLSAAKIDAICREFLGAWQAAADGEADADADEDQQQAPSDDEQVRRLCQSLEAHIRLVVFVDSHRQSHRVFFDSKTLERIEAAPAPAQLLQQSSQRMPAPPIQQQLQSQQKAAFISRSATIPARIGSSAVQQQQQQQLLQQGRRNLPPWSPTYRQAKQASDISLLRELVFGNVELTHKTACTKVHASDSPLKIYLSRLFYPNAATPPLHPPPPPPPHLSSVSAVSLHQMTLAAGELRHHDSNHHHSHANLGLLQNCGRLPRPVSLAHFIDPASTTPLPLRASATAAAAATTSRRPPPMETHGAGRWMVGGVSPSSYPESSASTGTGGASTATGASMSPPSPAAGCLLVSASPREAKAAITNLAYQCPAAQAAAAAATSSSSAASTPAPCRGDKIGICLIVNSLGRPSEDARFYRFFFTHNAFFDALLVALCDDVVQTLTMDPQVTRLDPLDCVLKSLRSIQRKVGQLFHCPRLVRPVWLTIRQRPSLGRVFAASCLRSALAAFNSARQNFFVSALVTAALTNHLAWLETAAPPAKPDHHQLLHGIGGEPSFSMPIGDKSRAYCAQWMQLCQLYSVLGYPRRVSRTLLVGSDRNLLLMLLYLLSYFVRCSDVMLSDDSLPGLRGLESDDCQPQQQQLHTSSASSSSSSDCTSDLDHSPPTIGAAAAGQPRGKAAATAPSPSSDYASDCEQQQQQQQNQHQQRQRQLFLHLQQPPQHFQPEEFQSLPQTDRPTFARRHYGSLGRSLLRGVSPFPVPFAALQGTTDRSILESPGRLKEELRFFLDHDVCDEPVSESVLLIADCDRWTVTARSLSADSTVVRDLGTVLPAYSVHSMLEDSRRHLDLGSPPAASLAHIESCLQRLERLGRALAGVLRACPPMDANQLAACLHTHPSDLPLLTSIATSQCRYVAPM